MSTKSWDTMEGKPEYENSASFNLGYNQALRDVRAHMLRVELTANSCCATALLRIIDELNHWSKG